MRKVAQIDKLGPGKLQELKRDLEDLVLVGDFIGNPDLIILIKYPRETIMFHSVMRKNRTAENARSTCFTEVDSFATLKKHHLEVVPHASCGTFDSYDGLCS